MILAYCYIEEANLCARARGGEARKRKIPLSPLIKTQRGRIKWHHGYFLVDTFGSGNVSSPNVRTRQLCDHCGILAGPTQVNSTRKNSARAQTSISYWPVRWETYCCLIHYKPNAVGNGITLLIKAELNNKDSWTGPGPVWECFRPHDRTDTCPVGQVLLSHKGKVICLANKYEI